MTIAGWVATTCSPFHAPAYLRPRKSVNEMRRGAHPSFLFPARTGRMITPDQLTRTLEQQLSGSPCFVVTAEVRPTGKVVVEVDNDSHITLAELASINRSLRDALGPALDDVELEVGSPGMGRPFRVMRQYQKHIGRIVEVALKDGRMLTGELRTVNDEALQLLIQHPSKVKGRLPKYDTEATTIAFAEIKDTRTPITFK